MNFKMRAECSIDLALKFDKKEYLFSIDLGSWHLFKKRNDESGYRSVKVLCFTFATLDRLVFDKWLSESLLNLLTTDEQAVESVRQDVM